MVKSSVRVRQNTASLSRFSSMTANGGVCLFAPPCARWQRCSRGFMGLGELSQCGGRAPIRFGQIQRRGGRIRPSCCLETAEAAHLDQQLDAGADGTKCRNLISRRRRPRCRGKPTRSTPSTKWIVAGTSGVVALSPDSTQRVPVVEESAVAVEERKKKERGVELAADK